MNQILFIALILGLGSALNPTIYEISIRPWLYELTQKYGRSISKINDIPEAEFISLKNQGVDYVWFMGIWALGDYGLTFDKNHASDYKSNLPDFTIDDVIGSPYAITEFVCNPQIGTDEDIVALRKKLNAMGLKLMLDFVPNHSACDSPYTKTNIDYYIRAPKGTPTPYDSNRYLENGISYGGDQYSDWKDTAQWNYWNNDARQYLKNVVMKIASMADGMRCDMAMVILNDLFYNKWQSSLNSWGYTKPANEFWAEAIKETKSKYPNTIFLAEVYWSREQQLIDLGFDYVYEKWLLDTLATFDTGKVKTLINSLSIDYAKHSNHFVENHDEPRAVSKFGGKDYIANAAAMLSYTLPGARFINHGQLEGLGNRLDVHLRRSYKESGSDYTRAFYKALLPILSRDTLRNGSWQLLSMSGDQAWKFITYKWSGAEKIVVVINYSEGSGYGLVKLPDASAGTQTITELMTNKQYIRDGSDMKNNGLGVIVDGWNGQIFLYS